MFACHRALHPALRRVVRHCCGHIRSHTLCSRGVVIQKVKGGATVPATELWLAASQRSFSSKVGNQGETTQKDLAPDSNPESTVLSIEDWDAKWETGDTKFHKDIVHPLLEKHLQQIVKERPGVTVFVPLCGKAVDMFWLYSMGHTVVGVEGVDQPIQEFFTENKLSFTSKKLDSINGTLYQSEDGRIKLYKCDLFDFTTELEGHFDAIWDRGSLVAVNTEDQSRYARTMTSLMSPGGRCLLAMVEFEPTDRPGPPRYVPPESLSDLYGEECNIAYVDRIDALDESWELMGMTLFHETVYLVTKPE